MHMDSLLNDSCRVAFAGLIYNLDTLFQRANLKGESPADALRSILGRAPVLDLWTTHPLSSGLPLFLIPELRAVSGNLRQPQATRGQVLRV